MLIVADGAPGLVKAIEQCWPASDRQPCWVHRARNIYAKLPGVCSRDGGGWTGARASPRFAPQLRFAAVARGPEHIYVARQLGHDARLTLTRYGHVFDELEEVPRIEAEAAIAVVRLSTRTSARCACENPVRDEGRIAQTDRRASGYRD